MTPAWVVEQEMLAEEHKHIVDGAPPRDMSTFTAWRESAPPALLHLYRIYGSYLVGQTNGLSDALNLTAVREALDLEEVPREDRPEMTQRLLAVHGRAMEYARMREKMRSRARG